MLSVRPQSLSEVARPGKRGPQAVGVERLFFNRTANSSSMQWKLLDPAGENVWNLASTNSARPAGRASGPERATAAGSNSANARR